MDLMPSPATKYGGGVIITLSSFTLTKNSKPMKLEELQKFCSSNGGRYKLSTPFSLDGYTYACDGRIIIRIPEISEARRDNIPRGVTTVIPPSGDDWREVEYPPGWESFDSPPTKCESCNGVGRLPECFKCDGIGECDHCGETCRRCDGTGVDADGNGWPTAHCEDCDGTGTNETAFAVSLNRGGVMVNLKYIKLIASLPGSKLMHRGDETAVLRFEFDGGIGGVMPMRDHCNNGVSAADQWSQSNKL
jgi:hypothetical protein